MDEGGTLELYQLIFGEKASTAAAVSGERLQRWAEAFEAWLNERRSRLTRQTVEDAERAWREFLPRVGKLPWEVNEQDIEDFAAHLQERGLLPGTIAGRLTGLSRFYEYCREKGVDAEEVEGGRGYNPVRQARRLRPRPYEKANFLSMAETRRLIEAIEGDDSLVGKRDLGLFKMLLWMGMPIQTVRNLRWVEVEEDGEGAWMVKAERGREQRRQIHPEVWEAIKAYLIEAGRIAKMKEEDFVFAPVKAPLVKEPDGDSEDWNVSRPLSDDQTHYLLKLYAKWAGLEAGKITFHTLRHTAAMLQLESGAEAEEVREFLGRGSEAGTRQYLRQLSQWKEKDPVATQGETEGATPPHHARGPGRLKAGDQIGLRHRLYAKQQPPKEVAAILDENVKGLEAEKQGMRYFNQRLMEMVGQAETSQEQGRLMQAVAQTATRLGELMAVEKRLADAKQKKEDEDFLQSLEELEKNLGGSLGLDQYKEDQGELAEAIAALRLVARQTMNLAEKAASGKELATLAEVYGMACARLMKLLKLEANNPSTIKAKFKEMIRVAIDQATEILGIKEREEG